MSSVSPRSTAAHAPNTVLISALCSAARAAIRTSIMPISERILKVQQRSTKAELFFAILGGSEPWSLHVDSVIAEWLTEILVGDWGDLVAATCRPPNERARVCRQPDERGEERGKRGIYT
eukprot:8314789-Heterocapsa_arctica.AAC.1